MNKWNVRLVGPEDPAFEQAFALVKQNYQVFYGANIIKPAARYFVFQEQPTNQIKACMSCTEAHFQRLFSEIYLDKPVEQYLPHETGRKQIIEIGSMASVGDPYSTQQLTRISTMLGYMQFKWEYALITSTPVVNQLLQDCGMHFYAIEKASVDKLPQEDRNRWGRYYESQPKVCLIDLKASLTNHLNSLMEYPNLSIAVDGSRP